jgi:glycosyltransferase involved in cell wall biosynthesis
VIPNPIDTVVFRPPSEPRAARPGAGTILYTGRVHPEKGVHLLVSAFAKLHEEFDRLRLRVVGPRSVDTGGGGDDYVEQLKRLAGDRPVEFIDPIYDRSALARELQSADYYCYPSLAAKGEALPVAPMEAMATGLPVVVSNLPVFRDILTPSHSGMVFDHTTSDAAQTLAQSLRQLIEDPLVAQRLGQQASQAAQRFSIENVASLCLEDFEQLIQR